MLVRKLVALGLTAAVFALVGPGWLNAHKLSVFAWVKDRTVYVEGKLGGGKRPKKGTVMVYNGKDQKLLEMQIQADGTVSFPLPADHQSGLKVVLDIGEGHSSYWILTPFDIEQQLSRPSGSAIK